MRKTLQIIICALSHDIHLTRQLAIMLYLSETPDAKVDYREIVDRVLGSKSAATQALEQLEESGLVARQRQPKDRRKAFVSLTDKGRALIRELEAA